MKERLEALKHQAIQEILLVNQQQDVLDLKVKYLGKKGLLTEILRAMGNLSAEERPVVGQIANEVRTAIEQLIEQKLTEYQEQETLLRLQSESLDVTLPGRRLAQGAIHPINKIIQEIEDIFLGMGFSIAEGPEVERDYYNFEALNLPKDHPARDMQDSFYINEEILLRTHTSPVQVRTMEQCKGEVPIKIISPGKVYRRDDDDATHSHQFTQIEGLVIDHHVTMSDLKGTLLQFVQELYGAQTQIRLRPSFFPFTEPSAEVDVSCMICSGQGCKVCKHSGWIEILGGGMVHPRVLEMSGYDPKKYRGFAFGMGPERVAMLKYGIEDIRHFYTNDLRFLQQFSHY
jgi:phenylalanyl-tRNA synthetase alpha chain